MLSSNDRRFPALLCRLLSTLTAEDSGLGPRRRIFAAAVGPGRRRGAGGYPWLLPTRPPAEPPQGVAERRRRLEVALLVVGLLGLLAASLAVAPLRHAVAAATHGDLGGLRLQLRMLGFGGVLVLVALVLAHTVIPFPAEIPAAAAGFVYGFAIGLPLMVASFLASALTAYALADWLGRPVARRLVGARRLEAVERVVGQGGVRTLLVLRLIPLVPFSLMCFVCGFGRVALPRYTWTTLVGMFPQLVLVTLLGSRLQHARVTDPLLWGPALAMIGLILLGPAVLGRRRRLESGG
jgi:uncharacterized membrane protein YdjX (TVP38/TMEM64 family)